MKKVYCSKCWWYIKSPGKFRLLPGRGYVPEVPNSDKCRHVSNIMIQEDDSYAKRNKHIRYIILPSEINRWNNCKNFVSTKLIVFKMILGGLPLSLTFGGMLWNYLR